MFRWLTPAAGHKVHFIHEPIHEGKGSVAVAHISLQVAAESCCELQGAQETKGVIGHFTSFLAGGISRPAELFNLWFKPKFCVLLFE